MQDTEKSCKKEKKYYYSRFEDDYLFTPEMRYLESVENGKAYELILMKLHLLSVKGNGFISRNGRPYPIELLAFTVNESEQTLREALDVLERLEYIGRTESGMLYITDFCDHVGTVGQEALRKREYRARIEAERLDAEAASRKGDEMSRGCPEMSRYIEIDKEKEKDTDIYQEEKRECERVKGKAGSSAQNAENEAAGFIPPTHSDVLSFSLINRLMSPADADSFYEYWNTRSWRTENGTPLTDWQARERAWSMTGRSA